MIAAERRQKGEAAGNLLAIAHRYERQADREIDEARALHLRGRALQTRGSAWVLQAEVLEAGE